MKEEIVINRRISGGMLGDRKRDISGYTLVINGATLSSPWEDPSLPPSSVSCNWWYVDHACTILEVFQ